MIGMGRLIGTMAVAAVFLSGNGVSWGGSVDGCQNGGLPGDAHPGEPPETGNQQGPGDGPHGSTLGFLLPGDITGDGGVDISDVVRLLTFLFVGGVEVDLTCSAPDFNGDGSVDVSDPVAMLSWLFLGGIPHALGEKCVSVAGCSDACADG